jgi:predicted membrane channel-forming protein YqfA (hemolysin III family)
MAEISLSWPSFSASINLYPMFAQFRVLQFVWLIMGFSQLILLVPAILVLRKGLPQQDIGGSTLLVFTVVLLIIAVIFPEWWYRKRLPQGAALQDPEKKLEHFRAPLLLGWILAEVANIMALISFLLNRDTLFLGFFAIGFALFYFRKANFHRFVKDYRVAPEDAAH